MTADQQAYIKALSQLAGVTDTFAANPLTDKTAATRFDTSRFLNDVQNAGVGYNNAYKSAINTIKSTAPLSGEVLNGFK